MPMVRILVSLGYVWGVPLFWEMPHLILGLGSCEGWVSAEFLLEGAGFQTTGATSESLIFDKATIEPKV